MNLGRCLALLPSVCILHLVVVAEEFVFKAGVRPPTPEEITAYNAKATRIVQIRLNSLGRTRMNEAAAARVAQGVVVAPIIVEEAAVPIGEEIVGVPVLASGRLPIAAGLEIIGAAGDVPLVTAGGEPVVGALPAVVDNSALNAFPPIRSQGVLGSCASFATTYYQMTHMTALVRGWNAKTGGDVYRFSPKWTYNLVNGGSDSGSSMIAPAMIEAYHGAARWSEWPYDTNFRAWNRDGNVWRNAIATRIAAMGTVSGFDTDEGLHTLKSLLVNGYALTVATYILSWEQKTIKDDLSTSDDDPWVGQYICRYQNGYSGPHGMTIVGYNDHIWCDVNENNVVDPGEKGALKIANSWGTGYWNGGFYWICYDALKAASAVAGGPTTNRASAFTSGYWVAARASYVPEVTAVFTVNHARRSQMAMTIGKADVPAATPAQTWYGQGLYFNGGNYAFDGTTTACNGTFALDFTELLPEHGVIKRYFLGMQDSALGPETGVILGFELQKADGTVLASCSDVPRSVADGSTEYVYIDHIYDRNSSGTVTVQAVDAAASEAGSDNGTFRISRTGSTAAALSVNFRLEGLAELTKDYVLQAGTAGLGGAVTIPAGASSVDVDLLPIDDWLVEGTETATLTLQGGYGYTVGAPASATVDIADDDPCRIVVDCALETASFVYMYVPEGGTAALRVRLSAQPASDVTVKVTKTTGDADISVIGGSTLLFTTSDWNAWKTATIAAAEDADTFSGGATVMCTAEGLSACRVSVSEIDNDSCNLILDRSAVDVPEGGSAQFNVKCSMAPSLAFTVRVEEGDGDRDIAVTGGASLAFSPSDWNNWKPVTLFAGEDVDGHSGTRKVELEPSDAAVGGAWSITAHEIDNDVSGPGIVVSSYEVMVAECGTSTFQVRLSDKPSGTLVASVYRASGDTDIVVKTGGLLTFTPANWCQNQSVTLEALQDPDAFNGTATIRIEIPGTAVESVAAAENDIDAVEIVLDTNDVRIIEGSSASLHVRLAEQPPASVTVNTVFQSGDPDITVTSGATLSFSPSDWNTWKEVTFSAAEDPDTNDDWTQFLLQGDGVQEQWIGAREVENDKVEIFADKTRLVVPEGGGTSFTIRLSMAPASDTTVTVAMSGDADITLVNGPDFVFTTSNWATPQTVNLAAAEDADGKDDWAQARCFASSLQAIYVSCQENDNDKVDILTEVSTLYVPEDGSALLKIRLSGPPVAPATVTVSRLSGDADLNVSGTAILSFDGANWNTYQSVTIAAAEDADLFHGWAIFRCYGQWGAGLNETTIKAIEVDNDVTNAAPTAVLSASPASGAAPLSVFFDASASSDSDGGIILYEYDFDYDGATFTVDDSGAALTTANHVYNSPGTYTAAVRVTDNGLLTDIDTETIVVSAGDTTAPTVAVSSIVIQGAASDNSGVVTVTVDGFPAPLVGTDFAAETSLDANPDTIPIVAEDPSSNTATINLTVSK